jgi:hypothetical protein
MTVVFAIIAQLPPIERTLETRFRSGDLQVTIPP